MNRVIQVLNIVEEVNFANPQRGRVYDTEGIAPACNTCGGGGLETKIIEYMSEQVNLPEELRGKKFRIRKLTPRECFRLMGVEDADIDKMQASGLSNSAQYKLAGNSIVVDVLYHIFRKVLIETGIDIRKGEAEQLNLF